MAKADTANVLTIDRWYEMGREYYLEAMDLEEASGDQEQIDARCRIAASHFWKTLVMGHPNAAYSLSLCFKQGVGTTQDDYVAKLLFGVALALNDTKAQAKIDEVQIPSSMNEAIQGLTQLVKDVQTTVSIHDDMDMRLVLSQLEVFDQFIKLPHLPKGHTITTLMLQKPQEPQPNEHNPQGVEHQDNHDASNQQGHDVNVAGAGQQQDDSNCCCIIL